MGLEVADPFGGDQPLAGGGLLAGGQERGVHGDVPRGGDEDAGDQGRGVGAV